MMLLRNLQDLLTIDGQPTRTFTPIMDERTAAAAPTLLDIVTDLAQRTGLEVGDIVVAESPVEEVVSLDMDGVPVTADEVLSVTITSEGALPEGVPPQVNSAVLRQVNDDAMIARLCGATDRRPVPNRMNARAPGTDQLCVHVSELADLCARQFVLSARLDCYPPSTVTGGHRVMWAIGRALEKHVRDQVLIARNRQGIYGKWSCACGEDEYTGEFRAGERCSLCHQELLHLGEPHLVDSENGVMGSPDLTLIGFERSLEVTEIKSMAIDQWRALEEPLANHKAQALLYRHLYQHLGHAVSDVVRILYVAKDFIYGSPYKEFVVNAHEQANVAMVETSLALAREVQAALANDDSLPERVCSGPACPRAKKCGVAVPCFNME